MSIPEIAQSYREAKNKTKQIKILSELNACSEEQIIVVLKGQKLLPTDKSRLKPKDTRINQLLLEGIATLNEEIQVLQEKLEEYKEKETILQSLIEMEEE